MSSLQVQQALAKQRQVLHAGTPGDNVTVAVIALRKLPDIPRTSASRLNLVSSSTELVSGSSGDLSKACASSSSDP